MKKTLLFALALLLCISLLGCTSTAGESKQEEGKEVQGGIVIKQPAEDAEKAITKLVEEYGKKLQMVSLQAPKDIVEKSMKEHYGEFVSAELLKKWASDPITAPGRLTSSPWPDRIEIAAIKKLTDQTYRVEGQIIEITSTEQEKGEAAAKRAIVLDLKKAGNGWVIDNAILGSYEGTEPVSYKNDHYGFSFQLPESWKGFAVIHEKWEGLSSGEKDGSKTVETGLLISIRHPEWTEKNPRQDIPIMVFTLNQWDSLQQGKFHIGAAPVGPRELGRNENYVFALPARYNYAFPTGFEEVEEILKNNPLQTYMCQVGC